MCVHIKYKLKMTRSDASMCIMWKLVPKNFTQAFCRKPRPYRRSVRLRETFADRSTRHSPRPSPRFSPNPSPSLAGRSPEPSPYRPNSAHTKVPQLSDETSAQAVNFFFQNHYHATPHPYAADDLVPIYNQATPNSVLHQAVEALSLISFSNHFPTSCLRDKAAATYGQALRSVNTAINDPNESRADSTLLAIFLLCMYEMTEGGTAGMSSYANYMRHLDGAVALLRHRGVLQFRDQVSLRLFQAARIQMIHTYLIHSRRIPDFAPDQDWLSDTEDYEDFPNAIVKLSLEMANIRAKARDLFTSSDLQPFAVSDLLQAALTLDEEASFRYNNQSETWRPRTVPCFCSDHSNCNVEAPCPSDSNLEDSNIWLGTPILHLYGNLTIAHHIMNYYIVRMFANAMVLRCLHWFAAHDIEVDNEDQFDPARGRLQQIIDNICCSVPYHTESTLFMSSSDNRSDDTSLYGYAPKQGAFFILTPLYFATLVETVPESQRTWLRGQMRRLSKDYGLKHADMLCGARPCVISGDLPWHTSIWSEEAGPS